MDINTVKSPILLNNVISSSSVANSTEEPVGKSINFGESDFGMDQGPLVIEEKVYINEEINQTPID